MPPPTPGESSGTLSNSQDPTTMCSVSGSSGASASIVTSTTALVSASLMSAPNPGSSSASSENDSQVAPPARTPTPTVLGDTAASQDTSSCAPIVSTHNSASESSSDPPTSNEPPITTLNDTADSQDATSVASTSKTSQVLAPAKESRKSATKKVTKPKTMCPAKYVSTLIIFALF